MTHHNSISRIQSSCIKSLMAAYLVLVGLFTVGLYPYTVGTASYVIPWKWNPPHICIAIWFVFSEVWLPIALVCSLPIAAYCMNPVRRGWLFVSAIVCLSLLSLSLIGVPYYIGSVGEITTSPLSSVIWTHRDFSKQISNGLLVLFPIVLAIFTPQIQLTNHAVDVVKRICKSDQSA